MRAQWHRNDRQISNAEVLRAVDLELGVHDTVLVSRKHRERATGVYMRDISRMLGHAVFNWLTMHGEEACFGPFWRGISGLSVSDKSVHTEQLLVCRLGLI